MNAPIFPGQAVNPAVNPYANAGPWAGRGIAPTNQAQLAPHDGLIFTSGDNDMTKYSKYLQNMAFYGGGPSVAQTQLQAGMGQAMGQAQALAASQRGINPALAARLAAQQQANLQQNTNVQSTLLRAQEQQNALSMLGGVTSGEQGYDTAQMQMQGQKDIAHTGIAAGIAGGLAQGAGAGAVGWATRAHGGPIPGKAAVKGDSPKNDTVPTMLSPGEVVLPRSVVNAKHPGDAAKAFLEHVKTQRKPGEAPNFAKVLQMHREMGKHLEKLCMGGKVK